MTDHHLAFWALRISILNAAAAFVAVILYFYKELLKPFFHRSKLKARAFDVFWVITSRDKYVLKYSDQDDSEHTTVDLAMPSNTDDLFLHIILRTRSTFLRTDALFEFDGDINEKPELKYWFHAFVAKGRREKRPDLGHEFYDPSHYVDYHGNYHIVDQGYFPQGHVITYGFMIRTRKSGDYKFKVTLVADGVPAPSSLILWVKDPPYSMRVRCAEREHGECFVCLHYDHAA